MLGMIKVFGEDMVMIDDVSVWMMCMCLGMLF